MFSASLMAMAHYVFFSPSRIKSTSRFPLNIRTSSTSFDCPNATVEALLGKHKIHKSLSSGSVSPALYAGIIIPGHQG